MTEAGLASLNYWGSDDDYGRTPERKGEELIVPDYFERALKQNRKAWEYFNALAPSYRRSYIRWITAARMDETRKRRIKEAVELLERNQKIGMK